MEHLSARKRVFTYIQSRGVPVRVKDISNATKIDRNYLGVLLADMKRKKQVFNVGYGQYSADTRTDVKHTPLIMMSEQGTFSVSVTDMRSGDMTTKKVSEPVAQKIVKLLWGFDT